MIIIYLLINGAIYDFASYCILGIKTFSNYIPYTNLLKNKNIFIRTLSILVPIIIIGSVYAYFLKRRKEILILTIYTISSMVVIYPIADSIHFLIGVFPSFIIIIIFINEVLKKAIKNERIIAFAKYLFKTVVLLISVISIIKAFLEYNSKNKNIELEHYKYCIMSENYISEIKEVEKYIQESEKEVYILDATACLYMIPINRYNKDYDMFLVRKLRSKWRRRTN